MTAEHDNPTSFSDVAALRRSGAVSAKEFLGRLQDVRDAPYWHRWAMYALLVLGATHLLAGVVFFFAYNWADLAPFSKFGILQGGILLSFVIAFFLGLERPAGQAVLIAASVLTGVLFAVIGQVYQTGADAWQLFAAWTVLILPWALASRSNAHWLLWIIVCITAAGLYGVQVPVALGRVDEYQVGTAVALLPLAFLAVRELALHQGLKWLEGSWFRRSLVLMSMAPLFLLAVQYVFGADSALIGCVAFVLTSAALALVYIKVLPEFSVLVIIVGFASLFCMATGGRLIFKAFDFDDAGTVVFGLFLLGAWCVFVSTAVVRLLRYLNKRLAAGADHE
ncbi:MAG: DUF2157 domain-containing protein [Woeseia sp.]|nr:DUF2157 domain-containing protein [Woeseia sp.]MBT8097810.1 DUF2157 domain-containing protein [Woeseia sp.]NNL54235.1 DUF2157 domain-containing protein [Woeseia sp.]